MSNSLRPHGLYSPRNSPGQNTGLGSCSLLQGIFPTQGSNPGLLHCRQILFQLNYQGSPRILEWVTYPFSSRSSQLRNQTRVFCIADGFFYQLSYQGSPEELYIHVANFIRKLNSWCIELKVYPLFSNNVLFLLKILKILLKII